MNQFLFVKQAELVLFQKINRDLNMTNDEKANKNKTSPN